MVNTYDEVKCLNCGHYPVMAEPIPIDNSAYRWDKVRCLCGNKSQPGRDTCPNCRTRGQQIAAGMAAQKAMKVKR